MASQSRKHRGYRSQKVVADWFQRHGWPFAESTGAGRSGSDLTGMPGLACEIKARSDLQPLAWLRQAEANPGLPFVIFRPNGMGERGVGQWGVLVRLEVFTDLLRSAGYGTPTSGSNSEPDGYGHSEELPQSETDQRVERGSQEQHDHHGLDSALRPAAELTTTHDGHGTSEATG